MKPSRMKQPGPPINVSIVVINNDVSQVPNPLAPAIRETAAGCLELVPLARKARVPQVVSRAATAEAYSQR